MASLEITLIFIFSIFVVIPVAALILSRRHWIEFLCSGILMVESYFVGFYSMKLFDIIAEGISGMGNSGPYSPLGQSIYVFFGQLSIVGMALVIAAVALVNTVSFFS